MKTRANDKNDNSLTRGPDSKDLAEFRLASWEGAILREKVDRGPAALDHFKNVVFQTVFSKPHSRSKE